MRVLISGAGIAGPTLAWFLSKTGAHITVVEKALTLLPHGQNVDIEGSALKIIKKMGLMEEFRRFNTTEQGTQFIGPNGQPFAPFPIRKGFEASLSSEFEILRGDLAAMLYKASKDLPNVNYLFDTTITSVSSNDDNNVKVELNNGEVHEFDLLVAADGQWSKIRKQCFAPEDVRVVDQGMYAVYWTIPRIPSDNNWWNCYFALGSRFISIRPDPHGTVRAMFTRMPCNDTQKKAWQQASKGSRKMQEELLREDFSNAGWQAQRLLQNMDQAPDFYFHPIQQIRMSRWSNSRVVCVGDTAYAPTPLTGMGTSLAITGAYILAGELSKLNDGDHPLQALEAYEHIFRPFVVTSQEIPSIIPGIAHPETALKRWLVQSFLSIVSMVIPTIVSIPWLAKKAARDVDREDFPLPHYSRLNDETSE